MTSFGTGQAPPSHKDTLGDGTREATVLVVQPEVPPDNSKMAYGTNKHPPFRDDPPLLIGDLPPEHVPRYTPPAAPSDGPDGEKNRTGRRLVIVGDVHGHLGALEALLRKIGFDHRRGDHLVFAGDMTTKGPNSKGVVKLAMELGASAVRGNQEDRVLAAAKEIGRLSAARPGEPSDTDDDDGNGADDNDDAETAIKKGHVHRVARSLTRAQLAWLRSLPIILRIGHLPDATVAPWNATALVVVHGGLVPGVPLEKQDPWAVMNMRSLLYPGKASAPAKSTSPSPAREDGEDDEEEEEQSDSDSGRVPVPISGREGEPWSHAWNRHQNLLPHSHSSSLSPSPSPTATGRTLAFYGHDAKAGLRVSPEVDISPWESSSSSSSSFSEPASPDKKEEESETKKKKHKKKKNKKNKAKGLRYAFGLDSGCGHERQLTAMVLSAEAEGVITHQVVQVECSGLDDGR
ncbi:hypothetical protein VTK26DRAFT_1602 [Humicola hyalothermophila]